MVGDQEDPVEFMSALRPRVQEWRRAVAANDEHIPAIVDPITTKAVDVGITSYVDHLQAKHVINTINQTTNAPIFRLLVTNEKLDKIKNYRSEQ